MKKLLGILVLGLLFISIDLSNPTTVTADHEKQSDLNKLFSKPDLSKMGFFERQKYKYNRYQRKKASCAEEAKSAETDYAAKKIYNTCMD